MVNINVPINIYSVDFKVWLKDELNLSDRARNDCFSRCRRVERDLRINLRDYFLDDNSYGDLMVKVDNYCKHKDRSKKSEYALRATLRGAIKKYATYSFPEKTKMYNELDHKRAG